MKIQRRQFLQLTAGTAALPAAPYVARAQACPARPITMIVPWPPGGIRQRLARMMAETMGAFLGQSIMIENVGDPRFGGSLGRALRAPGDGYALSIGINPFPYPPHEWASEYFPWELTDLEPIAPLISEPLMIVGRKDMPARDLKELVAWLTANPDKAAQAYAGIGCVGHLTGLSFQRETNTRFRLVRCGLDYSPCRIDLEMLAAVPFNVREVRDQKLRAYAVTSKTRLAVAPEIPTVDEAGLPGFYRSNWIGLWVFKGASKDVIATLNAAAQVALAEPSLRQRLRMTEEQGWEIFPREQQTPDGLAAEIEKWRPVIKAAGIKPRVTQPPNVQ
jgi:tripartite-type tricarboxylate transporter receptor subunit TctC